MRWKAKIKKNHDSNSGVVAHTDKKARLILVVRKLLLVVAFMAIAYAGYYLYKVNNNDPNTLSPASRAAIQANKFNSEGNESEALKHAREALALAPDDLDTIQAVILLIEKDNPEEAKKLYQHSLDVFKKRDNPDADGRPILTYWTAAGLAEKSGYTDQAKEYYQKVISVADRSNSEHQALYQQAQIALEGLR